MIVVLVTWYFVNNTAQSHLRKDAVGDALGSINGWWVSPLPWQVPERLVMTEYLVFLFPQQTAHLLSTADEK